MTNSPITALLMRAWASRERDERADLLAEAVDAGAATHFEALCANAVGDERSALAMLARTFPRTVPLGPIRRFLEADDPHLRAAVVGAIANRSPSDDVEAIVQAGVADPEAHVRIATIRAVRSTDEPTLLAMLEALKDDEDDAVRRWMGTA